MEETILKKLRRSRWAHTVQILVFLSWLANPFPGALSYWTNAAGVKTEIPNPPGDAWLQDDQDNDGLTNGQEVLFGTDPTSIDSDLDGLVDRVEYELSVTAFTAGTPLPYDPWNWDTDGDGFSDFDEYYLQIQGYQPVVNYLQLPAGMTWAAGTYFTYSDADGDGLKNFEDSDPLNMDRDGDNILNWNETAGQMDDPDNGVTPPPDDPGLIIGGNWYPTGTLDTDGDGTPDQYDTFPYGSYTYQGIEYGGSFVDSDGDNIPDPADSFPNGSYWYLGVEYGGSLVDQDGDTIPDAFDPWPSIAGSYDYNGTTYPGYMSDQDGDGIPDSLDDWPTIAGSYNYNGVSYPGYMSDQDNDGIPDALDPIFSGPGNSYWWNGVEYGGTPVDSDSDGIPDPFDPYPGIAGSYWYHEVQYPGAWADQDSDGVPDPADTFPTIPYSYWYQDTEYPGPWSDPDADGIPDAFDTYPNDWWNGAPHFNYNGTEYAGNPNDDRDHDGIPDAADTYPDDPTNHVDTDTDGLTDYDENTQYHTDPTQIDTDNDGLSDFAELVTYHTNPLLEKTNSNQLYSDYYLVDQTDSDSDGIPDRIEQWYASQGYGMSLSDPADATRDLDSDGYTNLWAYQHGWILTANINTYDSDQDGIFDVMEDAWSATYPGILSNSNERDAAQDFDGDGLMNFEEIALGLNPGNQFSRSPAVNDSIEWAWRGLVLGDEFGLSHHGLAFSSTIPQEWRVMADANQDGLPDGLQAFVTALNADPTPFTLPARVASGDYDADGMPDYWEHLNHLDARDPTDAQGNPDNDSLTNSQEYTASRNPWVDDDPPLQLTTTTLPVGTVGSAYTTSIQASGGKKPYEFSSTGSLPAGLNLGSSGNITGTPTAADSASFTVQVTDINGHSATRDYSLTTQTATTGGGGDTPPEINLTTTNENLAIDEPALESPGYSVGLTSTGGSSSDVSYAVSGLPDWLIYNPQTKRITSLGSSDSPDFTLASYPIQITVTRGETKTFDRSIEVRAPFVFVRDQELPVGYFGTSQSIQFGPADTSGAVGDVKYSLVSFTQPVDWQSQFVYPSACIMTPTHQLQLVIYSVGKFFVTVKANDSVGRTVSKTFYLLSESLPDTPPPDTDLPPNVGADNTALQINNASIGGEEGMAYQGTIGASGGAAPYTFSGGGGGLTVQTDGSVTGTFPSADGGPYTLMVDVTDSNGAGKTKVIQVLVGKSEPPPSPEEAQTATGNPTFGLEMKNVSLGFTQDLKISYLKKNDLGVSSVEVIDPNDDKPIAGKDSDPNAPFAVAYAKSKSMIMFVKIQLALEISSGFDGTLPSGATINIKSGDEIVATRDILSISLGNNNVFEQQITVEAFPDVCSKIQLPLSVEVTAKGASYDGDEIEATVERPLGTLTAYVLNGASKRVSSSWVNILDFAFSKGDVNVLTPARDIANVVEEEFFYNPYIPILDKLASASDIAEQKLSSLLLLRDDPWKFAVSCATASFAATLVGSHMGYDTQTTFIWGGTTKLTGARAKLYWLYDPQKPNEYASIRAIGYPAQYEGASAVSFAYHAIITIGSERADPSYGSANIDFSQWSFDPVYDGTATMPGVNSLFPASEAFQTSYADWIKAPKFYIDSVY